MASKYFWEIAERMMELNNQTSQHHGFVYSAKGIQMALKEEVRRRGGIEAFTQFFQERIRQSPNYVHIFADEVLCKYWPTCADRVEN